MELITFIKIVQGTIKSVDAVRDFIEGGEIGRILSAVGDSHFIAAKEALSDRVKSRDPNREIIMAITQLRVGFEAYIRGKSSKNLVKAYQASCLIILCYTYLREDDLAGQWLGRCNESFTKYVERRDFEWSIIVPPKPYVTDSISARAAWVGWLLWGIGKSAEYGIKSLAPDKHIPSVLLEERKAHELFISQYKNRPSTF